MHQNSKYQQLNKFVSHIYVITYLPTDVIFFHLRKLTNKKGCPKTGQPFLNITINFLVSRR